MNDWMNEWMNEYTLFYEGSGEDSFHIQPSPTRETTIN